MKKLIALALILASVFSLCACGEAAPAEPVVTEKIVEVPAFPEEYVPFKDLLDALVAEDYDSAQTILDELKPEPEVPPIVEVEITKDNFFDYFEYVCIPLYDTAEKDSQGNYTNVAFDVKYVLKDNYIIAKEKQEDCSANSGVTFKLIWYPDNLKKTIDFETFEYKVKGSPYITNEDAMFKGRCAKKGDKLSYEIPFYSGSIGSYCIGYINIQVYEDIELVSASGTLYLYE